MNGPSALLDGPDFKNLALKLPACRQRLFPVSHLKIPALRFIEEKMDDDLFFYERLSLAGW
jgi:hypothetical protein